MELEAKIADLGFSSKRYFFLNFVLENFHFEKSYGDFIFYVCELRCAEKNRAKFQKSEIHLTSKPDLGTTHSLKCPKDTKNGFSRKFYIDIVIRKFYQLFFSIEFFLNLKKSVYRKILLMKNQNP